MKLSAKMKKNKLLVSVVFSVLVLNERGRLHENNGVCFQFRFKLINFGLFSNLYFSVLFCYECH